MEPTDEAIATQVQHGDSNAFGVLVDRYEAKMRRYTKKFIASSDDRDDIVQDIFISAYKNIQSFDPSLRFNPWIYRIAHNACIDALRKNNKYVRNYDFDTLVAHFVADDPAESERERADTKKLIDKGLEHLTPTYREILVLHYYEDMPYKDIADVLQIPVGTVSIRMKRAKDALKAHITQHL